MSGEASGTTEHERLHRCLAGLEALEDRIEALLDRLRPQVQGHADAAAAFERFHVTARSQRNELRAHQLVAEGAASTSQRSPAPAAASPVDGVCTGGVSSALREAYLAFNDAALGYSVLHEVAHVNDSVRFGSTLRLAERHLRGYAKAAQEVNQLIPDVVNWELRQEGQSCECQCPSCSLGICWCIAHTTDTINSAWRDTAPPHPSPGLRVVPNARRPADLDVREGDVVISVDGHRAGTTADVTTAVMSHAPGEPIRLGIERRSVGTQEITTTRK